MCEAYTIIAVAAVIGAVASAAGTGVSMEAQRKQQSYANDVTQTQAEVTKNQKNAELEAYNIQADAKQTEEQKAYNSKIAQERRNAANRAAFLRAATGEAGLQGTMVDTLLNQTWLKEMTDVGTLEASKEGAIKQTQYEKDIARISSRSLPVQLGAEGISGLQIAGASFKVLGDVANMGMQFGAYKSMGSTKTTSTSTK